VNRTLSFVTRYYDGKIPRGENANSDSAFWLAVRSYEEKAAAALERAQLRDAFHAVFELSSFANKSFQDGEPWKTRTENPNAAAALIGDLCFVVRDLAVMMYPYMPQAAQKIAEFFGKTFCENAGADSAHAELLAPYKKSAGKFSWDDIGKPEGIEKVERSEVLFSKLEDEKIAALREQYSGTQKERAQANCSQTNCAEEKNCKEKKMEEKTKTEKPVEEKAAGKPAATVEPVEVRFAKTLDLRVAKIAKVERHPKADKLYILALETASLDGVPEERTIVSGLVPFYKEEELLGKKIIVAYNLKPAKLRGVESCGMLLAAGDRGGAPDEDGNATERVEVLDSGDAPLGTRVTLDGAAAGNPPPEIDIDTFFSIPIEANNFAVLSGGKALTIAGKPVKTTRIASGEVH
jgi:methionyl-tRNA synthetase